MKKTLVPILAIITGITSTLTAVYAETPLHGSASELERRVHSRRMARLQTDTRKSITELRAVRQDRSWSRPASTRVPTTNFQSRMEQRRAKRLSSLPSSRTFQVVTAINMERAKMGLAPLRVHKDLETSAQKHAQDMNVRDFFSHENPDGIRSQGRIKATGYGVINAQSCRCSYKVFLGENLAKGQTTVEQVIDEWMHSPSHRDAMLSRNYEEVGVGLVDDIWVVNFGKIDISVGG